MDCESLKGERLILTYLATYETTIGKLLYRSLQSIFTCLPLKVFDLSKIWKVKIMP